MSAEIEQDPPPCEEGAPAWMATFSDLCTLLLTFFVLLLSFANMDAKQFRDALGSVQNAFGVTTQDPGKYEARSSSIIQFSASGGSRIMQGYHHKQQAAEEVRKMAAANGLGEVVVVSQEARGVVMRIRDQVLFGTGSDQLTESGPDILNRVTTMVLKLKTPTAIEGHTDDRPINTTRFPSNWELSAARATAVLRYLATQNVKPKEMHIAGYADTHPVAPNDTDENRAKNRRVEFVFLGLGTD